MPNAFTLPLIAGLAVVGAAAGVGLGRSAMAEIDPSKFADPETAFHADLAANGGPDWSQVQAQEYAQAQVVTQDAPKPAGCVGCTTWPVEYVPRHDPTVDRVYVPASDVEYRQARARVQAPTVVVYEVSAPARERIVRYASYPVSREEADRMAQARQAEAQAREAPDQPNDPAADQDYAATQ